MSAAESEPALPDHRPPPRRVGWIQIAILFAVAIALAAMGEYAIAALAAVVALVLAAIARSLRARS